MKSVKIIGLFILLMMMFSFVGSVYAITGSIGNARMILRMDEGDEIEKYILVKNVNDVSIDVELFVSGDLEDSIVIRDDKFTLEPGSEKRAYFDLTASRDGASETRINVQFSPGDGGNGVGLSSTVIVIAKDTDGKDDSNWFSDLFGGDDNVGLNDGGSSDGSGDSGDSDSGDDDSGSGGVSIGGGANDDGDDSDSVIGNVESEKKPGVLSSSKLVVPTVSTLVLFAMLLGLLVWAKNKKNNIEEKDGIAKKKKEEKSNGDEKESKSKKSDKKG
jgi:hypothetical protein